MRFDIPNNLNNPEPKRTVKNPPSLKSLVDPLLAIRRESSKADQEAAQAAQKEELARQAAAAKKASAETELSSAVAEMASDDEKEAREEGVVHDAIYDESRGAFTDEGEETAHQEKAIENAARISYLRTAREAVVGEKAWDAEQVAKKARKSTEAENQLNSAVGEITADDEKEIRSEAEVEDAAQEIAEDDLEEVAAKTIEADKRSETLREAINEAGYNEGWYNKGIEYWENEFNSAKTNEEKLKAARKVTEYKKGLNKLTGKVHEAVPDTGEEWPIEFGVAGGKEAIAELNKERKRRENEDAIIREAEEAVAKDEATRKPAEVITRTEENRAKLAKELGLKDGATWEEIKNKSLENAKSKNKPPATPRVESPTPSAPSPEAPAGGSPERRDDVQKQMEAMIERMSKQEFDAMLDEVRKVLNRKLGNNENDSFATIAKKIKDNPGILNRTPATPRAPESAPQAPPAVPPRGPESPAPATPRQEGGPTAPHGPEAPHTPETPQAPHGPEAPRGPEGGPTAPQTPETPRPGAETPRENETPATPRAETPRPSGVEVSSPSEEEPEQDEFQTNYEKNKKRNILSLLITDPGIMLRDGGGPYKAPLRYQPAFYRALKKGLINPNMNRATIKRITLEEKARSRWSKFKRRFGFGRGNWETVEPTAPVAPAATQTTEQPRPAGSPAEVAPTTPRTQENPRERLLQYASENFEGFLKAAGKKIGMTGDITPERAAAAIDAYENLNRANRG